MHPARLTEEALLQNCEMRRSRASGPGGQHRNKVETAIEITHLPTGIAATASERRSQDANRQVAIKRLRLLLAIRCRDVTSPIVNPSELWRSRCRNGRLQCSDQHHDFPSMIAEALDAIDAKDADVKTAAAALGCSTSQLVRFIAKVPEALAAVNAARDARALRPLKP
ncbi:MAG: peptide chain release factor-like protein [Planctomycetaceae bacterium]